MAKQMVKSGLAGRLGDKGAKAVASHKDDETKLPGGGRLPAGIEQGIARLVDCRFSQYKEGKQKGEYFFLAAGVVVSPSSFTDKDGNVYAIEGERTQIMEPVCETPDKTRKIVDEHISWILNEMRKLGADTSGLTIENLEATAASIKEAAPHFKFRTWKGEKQTTGQYAGKEPLTQEQWRGATDFDGGVVDDVAETQGDGNGPSETGETTLASGEADDLDALGAAADVSPADEAAEAAQVRLHELATEAGVNPDEYATWAELAEVLKSGATVEEPTEPAEPKAAECYFYRPIDPKTKKPVKKAIECEVTAVFTGKKVVNLKNLDDNKTLYKSVPFDQLVDSPA